MKENHVNVDIYWEFNTLSRILQIFLSWTKDIQSTKYFFFLLTVMALNLKIYIFLGLSIADWGKLIKIGLGKLESYQSYSGSLKTKIKRYIGFLGTNKKKESLFKLKSLPS